MSQDTNSRSTVISLNQLNAWGGNVRKTASDAGLKQLAASIHAHGLLQALVVQMQEDGLYAVIAGRRRFLALTKLAEDGKIEEDFPVPCHVVAPEASATEISLVENAVREQMHPADEYEAFRTLVNEGETVADIAARFGVSKKYVEQRLALADVSPAIMKAFRAGKINLGAVMAYTVNADHERQEQVFKQVGLSGNDSYIRRLLTQNEVPATDKWVKFVTLKAYKAAGGKMRQDLFSSESNGGFLEDVALLDNLVMAKLGAEAEKVRGEGWKWVEVYPEFGYSKQNEMKLERKQPVRAPLSPEAQAEIKKLESEQEEIETAAAELDEYTEAQEKRLGEIEERIEQLEEVMEIWSPEIIAIAGAVVSVGHDGEADIGRGWVKPEDKKAGKENSANAEIIDQPKEKDPNAVSEKLGHELTSHRSAALSAELTKRPDIALAAIVHVLGLEVFYRGGTWRHSCLGISRKAPHIAASIREDGASAALAYMEKTVAAWHEKVPEEEAAFGEYCLQQEQATLLDMLAVCVADSLDGTGINNQKAEALASVLDLDMANWFKPTAANYFSRVSRSQMLSAVTEMDIKITPAVEKMKKGELAEYAEQVVSGSKWLPPLLRKAQQ